MCFYVDGKTGVPVVDRGGGEIREGGETGVALDLLDSVRHGRARVGTALEIIMSRPPSLEMAVWTVDLHSASKPIS